MCGELGNVQKAFLLQMKVMAVSRKSTYTLPIMTSWILWKTIFA